MTNHDTVGPCSMYVYCQPKRCGSNGPWYTQPRPPLSRHTVDWGSSMPLWISDETILSVPVISSAHHWCPLFLASVLWRDTSSGGSPVVRYCDTTRSGSAPYVQRHAPVFSAPRLHIVFASFMRNLTLLTRRRAPRETATRRLPDDKAADAAAGQVDRHVAQLPTRNQAAPTPAAAPCAGG